nr:MAG TPA: hypothetical protein [Caudoviricetes sp.]
MPILKNKKASKHKCLLAFYVCVLIQRKLQILGKRIRKNRSRCKYR